jgi:hypothetical protein
MKARSRSKFVISGDEGAMPGTWAKYRCNPTLERLTEWLRVHGVSGKKPLHTLRKEFGSRICDQYGIYAASRALRHADIAITSQHYLDKRARTTSGLGSLLAQAEQTTPFLLEVMHLAEQFPSRVHHRFDPPVAKFSGYLDAGFEAFVGAAAEFHVESDAEAGHKG